VRAGPFSNDKVIGLLNHYFVPVYMSIENVDERAQEIPVAEKAERQHVLGEHWREKRVMTYILAPDGAVIDTFLPSGAAIKSERMIELLERTIAQLKTSEGKPLLKPAPQSGPPNTKADSLVLHLTARYLPAGEGWARLPAEDWIVLDRSEWSQLLPPEGASVGKSWDIDEKLATKLLIHFYPPSPNNGLDTNNRSERLSLKARLVLVKDGVARVRIDGDVRMRHRVLPLRDEHLVEATVVGFLDIDLGKKRVQSVQLVTETATYLNGSFGVAVRSVP
jgi:hypothetical protein